MQDFPYIQAGIDDAIFIVIFIIIMISKLFAKIAKSQPGADKKDDFEITLGPLSKLPSSDPQNELEAFLQTLTRATQAKRRKPSVMPAVPTRPQPVERKVRQERSTDNRKLRQVPVVLPVASNKRSKPQTAPVKVPTAERAPRASQEDAYAPEYKHPTVIKDAYDLVERSSRIAGDYSLQDVRMNLGLDLISLAGIRKAVVLNEILGPPLALKKTHTGFSV